MADLPPSSRPPADPRSSRAPADATGQLGPYERPARWQTVAAVALGVVLVSIPLYLWRRPRSVAEPIVRDDASEATVVTPLDAAAEQDAALPSAHGVELGDARVLECRDPGVAHVPPERCDHVPGLEKGFGQAILDAQSCLPPQSGPATVTYVADVSFTHKHQVAVTAPKDGRSVRALHMVEPCVAAVRRGLSAVSVDGLAHAHARYKIAITATYPSSEH